MAKQDIGIGAAPNDGTGDSLRAAGQKINENFTELYDAAAPEGGTTGQALVKASDDDFDFEWADVEGGGGGGGGASDHGPYELIANIKLNADGTFPAIDVTGFRTVRLMHHVTFPGTGTGIAGITFRLNGDASEYYGISGYDLNNAAGANASNNGAGSGQIGVASSNSGSNPRFAGGGEAVFYGLDNAAKNTYWTASSSIYEASSYGPFAGRYSGMWNKADVVTSITLLQNFAAGSTIQVIGIRADAVPNPTHAPGGPASLELTPLTAFQNGWENYGDVYQPVHILKTGRRVDITGLIKSGGNGTVALTLPVGWRPSAWVTRITNSAGGLATIQIKPDGSVTANGGDVGTFIHLNASFDVPEADAYNGSGAGTAQGGAFPSAPVVGQRFYRTDRKIEYVWDGARWLSTQLHAIMVADTGGSSGNQQRYFAVPWLGTYSIWLERLDVTSYTNGGDWDVLFRWVNAADAATTIATADGGADLDNNWTPKSVAIGAQLDANAKAFRFTHQLNSGSGGGEFSAIVHYRLIG